MFSVALSNRIKNLPPYLFMEIDRLKEQVRSKGVDIIDLGVGDPDLPTPENIIKKLAESAADPANHRYPSYSGMNEFNKVVADWYLRRFGVKADYRSEVITLIGSKEGLAHFPLAFINPGDLALVPSPAYPVYNVATMFAGGESFFMPLTAENNFLPDLAAIPSDVADRAKIMFINYPNNPTGAVAGMDFYNAVVAFAKKHNIIVCHDAAYSELAFDGYKPVSFLNAAGAMEVGIEFHSLSKTYNMTGWRIGFAVGRAEIVAAVGKIKSNIDSGAFQAVQWAGIEALTGDQTVVADLMKIYTERRNVLVSGLNEAGLHVEPPKATFYLWIKVPSGWSSNDFTMLLLEKAGIVTTPGNGFGAPGEGYIRMTLCLPVDRLKEAVNRIKGVGF
ncbi:MAG: LL-diaminopimelate aminotransferase [Deltaproteobacteria bacterium]|nr:LL-diaminopimelate aminotransferase [Deltaproteobacteria bacterium]